MWHEQDFTLPADHPSAAGHFPGNPIIPGALLLDALLDAIPGTGAGITITITSTKFLRPIRHGTPLRLRWQEDGARLRFECRTGDDALMMTGALAAPP